MTSLSSISTMGLPYRLLMNMAQDVPPEPIRPDRKPPKDDPGQAPESGDKMPEKP